MKMIIQPAVNGVLMKKIEKKFQKNLIFQKKSDLTKPNTQNILKILFKKCTIPVNEIANSTGKYKIITGVKIVPSPKPEKKVKMAAKKVTSDIIRISIFLNNYFNGKSFLYMYLLTWLSNKGRVNVPFFSITS